MKEMTSPNSTQSRPKPVRTRKIDPQNRRPKRSRERARALPKSEESKLYSHFTPAYEALFPLVARKRILSTLENMEFESGDRVLEVGVGTGASLEAYPKDIEMVGIDLSNDMLAIAQKKIDKENWSHIQVQQGNAEDLDFEDESFDCVTTFHTVSVVSNPARMMSEIVRVVRPGGQVLVINHFRSPRQWIANVVDCADLLTRHIGWRTDLECESIVQGLPLRVEKRYKTSPISLFTVLKATRI